MTPIPHDINRVTSQSQVDILWRHLEFLSQYQATNTFSGISLYLLATELNSSLIKLARRLAELKPHQLNALVASLLTELT